MIFIVGYSRSGTKMMNQILKEMGVTDFVPEIHFFEQSYDFESDNISRQEIVRLVKRLIKTLRKGGDVLDNGVNLDEIERKILDGISRDNRNEFSKLEFYKKVISHINTREPVDPTPRNAYYMSNIARILPEARFIYMIRDPRDCILSQSKKWKNYLFKKKRPYEALRLMVNYNPGLMVKFWKNSLKELELAENSGLANRIFVAKYEMVIESPLETMTKVSSFLNVELSDHFDFDFIKSGNSGKWKLGFSKPKLFVMESRVVDELRKFNYELNQFSYAEQMIGRFFNILYWFKAPFAFVLNIYRMNKPIEIIKKRMFK